MLDMAEMASSTIRLDRMNEVSSEDGDSEKGSLENLLPKSPKVGLGVMAHMYYSFDHLKK